MVSSKRRKSEYLRTSTWGEVRAEVVSVNKELAEIIDAISPGNSYKFVIAEYSYGDLIVKDGVLQLPTNDELTSLDHTNVGTEIKNQLSYGGVPLMLSLDKDNEVFIDTSSRIVPLNLFHKGNLLGLFEAMDFLFKYRSKPKWSVSAGSRSVVMLPKITDKLCLKRLRMFYDIPSTVRVKYLSDHWELFKLIAQHQRFTQPWTNKMLFFGKSWLTCKSNSPEWSRLRNYLFQQAWRQAQFSMGKIELSLSWEKFIEAISLRNLKPRPYLADQVKHILLVATGKLPAFRPANDSQQAVPLAGLEDAFINTYTLKRYLPTMMHIYPLNTINKHPVYYSLSFPTLLEGSPLNKTSTTVMLDMRDIKQLTDTLRKYSKQQINSGHPVVTQTQFDYFHPENDALHEIRFSSDIPFEDEGFLKRKKQFPERDFCSTSQFLRGCIKITSSS